MSSILDILNSDLGKSLINGAAAKTGQSQDKTSNLLSQALPVLLGAMQRNAATPQGAKSLNNALEDPRHSGGGISEMLGGLLSGGDSGNLLQEGSGILGHVLGGKQPQIESALANNSGMDSNSVSQILKIAAPIVMGMLSKQKQVTGTGENGLGDLLGSVLGQSGNNGKETSFLTSILDQNGDGSIIDDVADMVMGGDNKKKGGLGGLLGGLFGKR